MRLASGWFHPRRSAPHLQVAGATHRGLTREVNEDCFSLLQGQSIPPWCLAVAGVFDGVGGLGHGAEASTRAAQYLEDFFRKVSRVWVGRRGLGQTLQGLIAEIHQGLKADARHEPHLMGMATTAAVAVLPRPPQRAVWLAHVGDSSAFRLRAGHLQKLTVEDSLVSGLLRDGLIGAEQAKRHPQRHTITQALGHGEQIDPHVGAHQVKQGDRLLLCTDGLTNLVPPAQLQKLLAAGPPGTVCTELIAAANAAGGTDNITVVVMAV